MQNKNWVEYIEANILRLVASRRGGGIEIDLSAMFGEDCKMSAYQNYLGGGLIGAVQSDYNFKEKELTEKEQKDFEDISEALKKYFFTITNEEARE
jgi:hypothetical protein